MQESPKQIVKQMQNISYQILCDIDRYCVDNNITYFLSGGTCLGAIRHKGFIPWDDDVDIMLPREDYERLLINFEKSYVGKYQLGSFYTDNQWSRPYARIWDMTTELVSTKAKDVKMGIFVDIFPIDGLPSNTILRKIYYIRLKILNVLRNAANRTDFYDYERYRNLKKFLGILTKPFKSRSFAVWMDKIAKKHPFNESEYVGASLAVHYWEKEVIKKECMACAIRVPFESGEFPVPVGYDQYLKNLYGDYMTIPKDAEGKEYTHLDGWSVRIKSNNI